MIIRGLVVTFLLLVPFSVFAEGSNAGIVDGLWFSQEPFFAGEPVRVYVAVRNNTGADLSGTVEFFVNGERIERNNIDALDGRIVESWGDWTPEYGTSTVSATLSRTEISSSASGTSAITVTSALAEVTLFIDRDTDGDQLGDLQDKDDDNDTIPDQEDAEPLVFNDPEPIEPTSNESEDDEKEDTSPSTTRVVGNTSTGPDGLEQFLTDDTRLDTVLGDITEQINATKRDLDAYREERSAPPLPENQSVGSSSTSTNADGFGDIIRSQSTNTIETSSWWDKNLRSVHAAATAAYTILLSALSFALGYPIFIQLFLLVLLLYLVYKIAKRYGSRPE